MTVRIIGDSLECRYLGWGDFNRFQQMPLSDNEALIYTIPGAAPALINGFLDCLRSEVIKARVPEQFSENDLAEVMVGMVRTLPDSVLKELNEWSNNADKSSSDAPVVGAVLRW